MELNDAMVLELADRASGYAFSVSAERAEAKIAEEVAKAREQFSRNGLDLLPAEAIAKIDHNERQRWDKAAFESGLDIEIKLNGAAAIVEDRITAAKVLQPALEPPVSRTERQMEEFITFMHEDRMRARYQRQTRAAALRDYEGADETTQAGRRLIAFMETSWSSMEFRDDPEHDAMVIPRVRAAIETRQLARVPAQLLEWRRRLEKARRSVTFTETLQHLRSGKGLAVRPRPLQVAL
jgi:hypothetical protein